MYYEDFNIKSGKADFKLFTDADYQDTVNYTIMTILSKEPLSYTPDTLWIDADANTLHIWDSKDREATERTMVIAE